jgi:hypothetical protein
MKATTFAAAALATVLVAAATFHGSAAQAQETETSAAQIAALTEAFTAEQGQRLTLGNVEAPSALDDRIAALDNAQAGSPRFAKDEAAPATLVVASAD